jgi:ferredoxin
VAFAAKSEDGGRAYPQAGAEGPKQFNSKIGRLLDGELAEFLKEADDIPRTVPSANIFSPDEAQRESQRCLHCDCRKADSCKLRDLSTDYQAEQRHFKPDQRNPFIQTRQHAGVIYEPEKCIKCGLCVQITKRDAEPLGLAFIGRGFDVRIGVPFNEPLTAALTKTAEACVAACPTAALARAAVRSQESGVRNQGTED